MCRAYQNKKKTQQATSGVKRQRENGTSVNGGGIYILWIWTIRNNGLEKCWKSIVRRERVRTLNEAKIRTKNRATFFRMSQGTMGRRRAATSDDIRWLWSKSRMLKETRNDDDESTMTQRYSSCHTSCSSLASSTSSSPNPVLRVFFCVCFVPIHRPRRHFANRTQQKNKKCCINWIPSRS